MSNISEDIKLLAQELKKEKDPKKRAILVKAIKMLVERMKAPKQRIRAKRAPKEPKVKFGNYEDRFTKTRIAEEVKLVLKQRKEERDKLLQEVKDDAGKKIVRIDAALAEAVEKRDNGEISAEDFNNAVENLNEVKEEIVEQVQEAVQEAAVVEQKIQQQIQSQNFALQPGETPLIIDNRILDSEEKEKIRGYIKNNPYINKAKANIRRLMKTNNIEGTVEEIIEQAMKKTPKKVKKPAAVAIPEPPPSDDELEIVNTPPQTPKKQAKPETPKTEPAPKKKRVRTIEDPKYKKTIAEIEKGRVMTEEEKNRMSWDYRMRNAPFQDDSDAEGGARRQHEENVAQATANIMNSYDQANANLENLVNMKKHIAMHQMEESNQVANEIRQREAEERKNAVYELWYDELIHNIKERR